MTAIIKKLLALATAFTLALSFVGCGVDVTGVSLNLPDTIEKGTVLVATPEYAFDGATTAEILCSGATSASAACTGWKNSPSHYSNIMTPGYTQMGIACTFNTAYGVEVWCVTFS